MAPKALPEPMLLEAWQQLPEGWFYGAAPFRAVAIAVTGKQGNAGQIREKLLKQGRVEAVKETWKTWRYRKVGG